MSLDNGLLKEIAATRFSSEVGVRDFAIHEGMRSFRFYIRSRHDAFPEHLMSYACHLGVKDPNGAYRAAIADACERLAPLRIGVRHVQIAWTASDRWMPRLKICACLEERDILDARERLAIWRALRLPASTAIQIAGDYQNLHQEQVGVIIEGTDAKVISGETYHNPAEKVRECVSTERFVANPRQAVISNYASWKNGINVHGLARICRVDMAAAARVFDAFEAVSFPAITVAKHTPGTRLARGVSLEVARLDDEGFEF